MKTAIDLFAGLGGNSTAARQAGLDVRWAANHWPLAVDYHQRNHPDTIHACQNLHHTNWTQVPRPDVLIASPACQGHSPARGKEKAYHDAQRGTADVVLDAAEILKPEAVVVENVPEILKWVRFPAWKMGLEALGYAVSIQVLDAADFGVAQHRERMILVGTQSKHPVHLRLERQPHIPASAVIDFNAGKWSKVHKPGRAPATLRRIARGRASHGDRFLAPYYGSGSGETGRSLDRPIGTLTTRARWAVIDGDRMRMVSVPEACKFTGLPEGYIVPKNVADANHMIGNAVPPPLMRHVLIALQRAI